ncbi:MAG: zinc ribbon domain-containing protein [Candidatus Bathyarchaeia archaeon]
MDPGLGLGPKCARIICRACGYESNADLNAARNILWRADVDQPIAVCQRVLELEPQAHPL